MNTVEFTQKILPFDENLQQELAKLEAEGWQGVADIKPTVTYTLFRNVAARAASSQGRGGVTIDDSKVHVVRDGKIIG